MYTKHEIGKIGEKIAVEYLRKCGYKIIETNFFARHGEIDIIAKDKKYYVFVEVKTRTNLSFGNPVEAVDKYKQNHIYKSAKYYLYINKLEEKFVRFDVIEVFISKNNYKINHIKQVL